MKRVVCLFIICLLLCANSVNVFAADGKSENFPFRRIAVLSMSSSAEGSNINYFVVRPVICHTDNSGETDGTMFDAVVLDIGEVGYHEYYNGMCSCGEIDPNKPQNFLSYYPL